MLPGLRQLPLSLALMGASLITLSIVARCVRASVGTSGSSCCRYSCRCLFRPALRVLLPVLPLHVLLQVLRQELMLQTVLHGSLPVLLVLLRALPLV